MCQMPQRDGPSPPTPALSSEGGRGPSTRVRRWTWLAGLLSVALLLSLTPSAAGRQGASVKVTVKGGEGLFWLIQNLWGFGKLIKTARRCDAFGAAGRYAEALKCTDELQAVAEEREYEEMVGIARRSRIDLLVALGLYEETQREIALYIRWRGGSPSDEERSFFALKRCVMLSNRGDYKGAWDLLYEAEALYGDVRDMQHQLRLASLRAQLLSAEGEIEQALETLSRGLDFDRLDSRQQSTVRAFRGLYLAHLGRHTEAIGELEAALPVLEKNGLRLSQGQAHYALGLIYEREEKFDLAEQHYAATSELAAGTDLFYLTTMAYHSQVNLLIALGRPEEAARALHRLRSSADTREDWPVVRGLVVALEVRVAAELGEYQRAIKLAARHTADPRRAMNPQSRLSLLGDGLRSALALEDIPQAQRFAAPLREWTARFPGHDPDTLSAYLNLGKLSILQGEYDAAERDLTRALDLAEQQRLSVTGTPVQRAQTSRMLRSTVSALVNLHCLRGQPAQALAALERGRARLVADLMETQGVDHALPLTKEERAQLWAVEQEIEQLLSSMEAWESTATRLRGFGVEVASEALQEATSTARQNEALLSRKLRERAVLEESYYQKYRISASLKRAAPVGAEEILLLPHPGEALLTWYVTDTQSWVFAWDDSGIDFAPLELTAAEVEDRVGHLRGLLNPTHPAAIQDVKAAGEAAWRDLIGPVASRVNGAARWVIIPHGPLHHLSFAPLRPEGTGRWLSETVELSRAVSASALAEARRDKPALAVSPILVVGAPTSEMPPLPGSLAEARAVAELFGDGASLMTDSTATEVAITQALTTSNSALLSAHAIFLPADPMSSYIRLASSAEGDGRLDMGEIMSLPGDLSLVVLSGCSTGLADEARPQAQRTALADPAEGDDIMSLALAFRIQGASHVVATLWEAADASSEIFIRAFYSELHAGHSAGEALHRARLGLLREPVELAPGVTSEHPAYWAPFFLLGPGGAQEKTAPSG